MMPWKPEVFGFSDNFNLYPTRTARIQLTGHWVGLGSVQISTEPN